MWIVVAVLTAPWRQIVLHAGPISWFLAVILFAAGLWLYLRSSKGFSAQQLGGLPELHQTDQEQRLVVTGIRSKVRHPVYLAHLLEMLAWSLGTGLAICYALTAFAFLTGIIMISAEDEELEKRFGQDYKTYRESVPAIFPRL
jgi:protein-S-isoprenylcysteine O-methyltransferase Ste14